MDRIEVKTAENQRRQEFIQDGYLPQRAEALVNCFQNITNPYMLVSDKMDKSSTGQ